MIHSSQGVRINVLCKAGILFIALPDTPIIPCEHGFLTSIPLHHHPDLLPATFQSESSGAGLVLQPHYPPASNVAFFENRYTVTEEVANTIVFNQRESVS